MSERITLKNSELVLKVNKNVNPQIWDETKYYHFLDVLCKNREYQKEAILTALRFLLSGNYSSISELAQENYAVNKTLVDKYPTFNSFLEDLHFPEKLSASIDLATGTGKSYVLYGISIIMLLEKVVDQVLILVPSVTIESELTKKFKDLSIDSHLLNSISKFYVIIPKIINGSESIVKGTICIENRDSIYKNSKSSIIDSLKDNGSRTLLLNDEVHHVYNLESNEWKKFIQDSSGNNIDFKYLIGVSGTCYSGNKHNSYFSDVIYRYSLKEAIEDGYIKHIEYLDEASLPNKNRQKWEVIYNSHNEIKRSMVETNVLPLTIFVTANTKTCDSIADQFKDYLISKENLNSQQADEKIIIVHSKPVGARGRLKLPTVDLKGSKVEWIFSVSMLTEGWDVKRVFQIVPHEERAFNSKLLISQVLGRGVRIPEEWNNAKWGSPKVTVFNHENWSKNIKGLVNEILEIDKQLNLPINSSSELNFLLDNIDYNVTESVVETDKESIYQLFEKGYVELPTHSDEQTVNINFVDATSGSTRTWQTTIKNKTYSIDDIAKIMYDRFEDLDDVEKTEKYQKTWTISKLKEIIENSLNKSSNQYINDELKQRFLSSLGTVFRDSNKTVSYESKPQTFTTISTADIRDAVVGASSLRARSTLYITSDTELNINPSQRNFYEEVIDTSNRYSYVRIDNKYHFRTPQAAVVADSSNEKGFIDRILKCGAINRWIKSTNTGFYSFEYSWRKGEHPKKDYFNPDFFIIVGERVLVVEVKGDEQLQKKDPENAGKCKSAVNHFGLINEYLNKNEANKRYKFTMISPKNFDDFFRILVKANLDANWELIDNYYSELDILLNNK